MADSLPVGASVPALGLSNKAVYEGERLNAGNLEICRFHKFAFFFHFFIFFFLHLFFFFFWYSLVQSHVLTFASMLLFLVIN